jgi:glycosyltransferase involved in cell wall biosynthesis
MCRNDLLFGRSLASVLSQSVKPDCVLVVDDNDNTHFSDELVAKLNFYHNPNLHYFKNCHTHGCSGTGAWNSGIEWYASQFIDCDYIAFLDDDDSWESTYLECQCNTIDAFFNKNGCLPEACCAYLKRSDCPSPHIFKQSDITIENFLCGNIGIQGSNMFFSLGTLKRVNGFDEMLPSCTDRDMLIRLLQLSPRIRFAITPMVLVNHFAWEGSITYDKGKKHLGITRFFEKYIHLYTPELLEKAVLRAEKLFDYNDFGNIYKLFNLVHGKADEKKFVIGIALHNGRKTIRRCIQSILDQENLSSHLWVLIADDDSNDGWEEEVSDLLALTNVMVIRVKNNATYKTRNDIHAYTRKYFGNVALIGRLDCDDVYSDNLVLSRIEQVQEQSGADVVLAGNYLRLNNKVISRVNRATKDLLDSDYLINRLRDMSNGIAEAELPSCNVFMSKRCLRDYPAKNSAEDHFLLVDLLLGNNDYKIAIAEDVLLTIYNLNGKITADNKRLALYLETRKELYQRGLGLCKMKKESNVH